MRNDNRISRYGLCLLLFLAFNNYIIAEIKINSFQHASSESSCDGHIEVLAKNDIFFESAGPFEVFLNDTSVGTINNSGDGLLQINNLCKGNYTIKVVDRLGCDKNLSQMIGTDAGKSAYNQHR